MKKVILVLTIFLLLHNCNKKENIQSISLDFNVGNCIHMLFVNEKIGYIFSNYESFNTSNTLCIIYETTDGGKSWKQEKKYINYIFSNAIPHFYNDDLYFSLEKDNNFVITSLKSDKFLAKSKSLYSIFDVDDSLYYSSLLGITNLETGKLIKGILIGNETSSYNKELITIQSNNENDFFVEYNFSNNYEKKNIDTNLSSLKLANEKQDNNFIFSGKDTMNNIKICKLNPNGKVTSLYSTDKYTIADNLQTNNSSIICLLGNISGNFVKYDILYSLDKGASWKIMNFDNLMRVNSNFLIKNKIYMISDPDEMKIITLK